MDKFIDENASFPWNCKISFDTLANEMYNFFSKNLPIYSIGSGRGGIEAYYEKKFHANNVICIDPFPKNPVKTPSYPNIHELLSNTIDLVNEGCQVMIIWSTPSLKYDIEAINLLKPIKLMVLYDARGASGSNDFHDWLLHQDIYEQKEIACEFHNRSFCGPEYNIYVLDTFTKL